MRPVCLEISGFGAFCDPVKINFNDLGKSGLYLICGDTGAGKTTIFDAITFALYGEVNGNSRRAKMMRSLGAGPEIPSEVTLEFEYKEKTYIVKRNLEYVGLGKKDGTTKIEKPSATLTNPDGTVISGYENVTEKIKEILGITQDEFSQIEMIAQGEFKQVLFCDTAERKEIFRKLFKTDYYVLLQNRLKDEENNIAGTEKDLNSQIKFNFENVLCNTESSYFETFEEEKKRSFNRDEKIEIIKNILEEDIALEKKLKKEYETVKKEYEQILQEETKIEGFKNAINELENIKKSFEQKKILLEKYEKDFIEISGRQEECESKQNEAAVLEKDIPVYEDVEKKRLVSQKLREEITAAVKEIEDAQIKLNSNAEKLEDCKKIIEEYSLCGEEKIKAQVLKDEYTRKLAEYADCEMLHEEYLKLKNEMEKLQAESKIFIEAFQKINGEFTNKQILFYEGQAGLLAEMLEENKPCPVCGSLDHPKIAHKEENVPTQQELNLLKKDVDDAQKKMQDSTGKTERVKGNFEKTKKMFTEKLMALNALENDSDEKKLEEALNKIESERISCEEKIDETSEKIAALEKHIIIKTETEKQIPVLEKTIKEAEDTKNNLEKSVAEKKAAGNEINKTIQELREGLLFKTQKEAQDYLNKLLFDIKQIKSEYEKVRNLKETTALDLQGLSGKKDAVEKQLSQIECGNEEEVLNNKAIVTKQKDEMENILQSVSNRIENNKKALAQIEEKAEEIKVVEEKHKWITSLYKTAIGNLGDKKQKIDLETFIQMTYFDRVLQRANIRLAIMTGNDYVLKRSEKSADGRSATGLDLDIIDNINRNERSVKTLSGGESFMASLALALGLSDEIQSGLGGIQLDSLFVDEGFGSLDDDSLSQAYKALNSLTEGNRMVGIISHVESLEEKIGLKIKVTKDKQKGTSSVEVINEL